MKWLENITGGYSSSATVINDTLVLSLPDAQSPIVWRMKLDEIKAAAFEIDTQENGIFLLVMKKPKGETQEIAPFDVKSKAIKALMAASKAMEHAETVAQNDNNATPYISKQEKKGSVFAGLFGIVLLGALLFALTKIGPQPPAFQSSGQQTNASVSGQSEGGSMAGAGVPVSADDFLSGQ